MRIVTALFIMLSSSASYASYLESCEITATVLEVDGTPTLNGRVTSYTQIAKIKIDSAINQGSHVASACKSKVGTEKLFVVEENTSVNVGDQLVLDFFHVNNMGPEGVVFSESWAIREVKGQLAYRCSQLDRSIPFYQVQLRQPTGPVRTDSVYYNVYVTRDDEIIASEESVRVSYLPGHDDAFERQLTGEGFALALKEDKKLPSGEVVAVANLVVVQDEISKRMHCIKVAQ